MTPQIDDLLDTIVAAIAVARRDRKVSRRQIAISAGVHPNIFRNVGKKDSTGAHLWTPSTGTIRALERILFTPALDSLPPVRRKRVRNAK